MVLSRTHWMTIATIATLIIGVVVLRADIGFLAIALTTMLSLFAEPVMNGRSRA